MKRERLTKSRKRKVELCGGPMDDTYMKTEAVFSRMLFVVGTEDGWFIAKYNFDGANDEQGAIFYTFMGMIPAEFENGAPGPAEDLLEKYVRGGYTHPKPPVMS